MPAWSCASCLVLLLTLQLSAAATVRALDAGQLQVWPGATCLDADSLTPLVEQWLYGAPLPRSVAIEVHGSDSDPRSARFRVRIAGEIVAHRAFEPGPPRCEQLRAVLGLAIALTLRVSLLSDLGEPLPDDPRARTERWSLSALGLGSDRILPAVAPGLELRMERGLGPTWAVRVGALGVFAPGVDLARAPAGFDALLIAGRAEGCVRGQLTLALSARVCVGVLAGALHASGRGAAARSATLGFWAVANAAALGLALSERWSMELELSVIAPLRQLRIGVVDTNGQVLETRALAAVGFGLGIGPSYHF